MAEAHRAPQARADQGPFVGRTAETELLDSVLDRIGDGGPAVVDVTGEAGIGKSRFLARIHARARTRGLTVLSGKATEYEQHSPFRPFADAFADLDPEVAGRFPALAQLSPVLREAGRAPSAADRFSLYQATAAALGGLGRDRFVVVLDDLHCADPASLELMSHLLRHPLPSMPLLVVSRRHRQTSPVLTAALARGLAAGSVLRVSLGPLTERDCVEDLAGGLSPPRAAELYRASGGNPLYFLALVHADREARRIPQPGPAAGPEAGADSGGPDGLPTGLGALLLDELAPLSPAERRVLEAAAVLGDHATPELIGSLTGTGAEAAADALRALMDRDLVRTGHGGRRLALRHPLIRALVHDEIEPWRREELHRRAAAGLAAAGASAVARAHHVEQSVTYWDPLAAAVLMEAADQTCATAPASCAHWLGVVLRLLPDGPDHLILRRELTLRRARALGVGGGLQESRDLLRLITDGPAPGPYDEIHISAVTLRAQLERQLGRHREAEALLRRELARTPAPSPAQAVWIGLELCSCVIAAARFPEVRAEITGTLATARALGDEIAEIGALTLLAMGEAYEGEVDAARAFAGPAAALADATTDADFAELCEFLCTLGWTEAFLEDYPNAERHLDRGLGIARRTGQVYLVPHFLTAKAYIHLCTCRITSALELAEEAEPIARTLGSGDMLAFVLAFQSQILLQARRPAGRSALEVAEEAVASADAAESWWANVASCMLGYAALDAGDPHRAVDALLRTGGGSELRHLQPTMRPNYLEVLTGAALALGQVDTAGHWAERANKEAQQLGLPAQRGAGLRSLGQVAAVRGDPAEAARLFTAAAAESARSGATLREAQSLLLAAAPARAAGRGAEAAALWHRGSRLAAEGGAHLLTGLAERLRPLVFAEEPEPVDELAALTKRERQVAILVAQGLTSRAIASRLKLSPRTVESHIARIYQKTGAPSRAALASLVTRDEARDGTIPPTSRSGPTAVLTAAGDPKDGGRLALTVTWEGPRPAGAGGFAPPGVRAAAAARPLVGREPETEAVAAALAALASGRGRAIALVGEPGIGKSALLWTATAHAQAGRVPVFAAHGGRTIAFPLPGGQPSLDVRELGRHVADRTAVLAALDDLHELAADQAGDVERLIEAAAAGPVLCVLAYRQRQLSPPLAAVLSRASSAGLLDVWTLPPLSRDQARDLLGDHRDADAAYEQAEGNPQYLKILSARTAAAGEAGTAVLGELAGLDPAAVTVLEAASVLGRQFPPELLAAVAQLGRPAVMAALDALSRRDLIRPAQPAPQLTLRHPAVGQVVYQRLEPGRRTGLHRRAEAELAEREAPIGDRAFHIARAADPDRPEHVRTLIAAARELLHTSPVVATGHLQVALSLLPEGAEHRYEAQVLLARCRLLTGDAAEGRAILGALRSELSGGPADDAAALADSSRIERHSGRYTEAGALARAGLAALTDSDSATAAALHAELADYAYDVQDYQTARQHAETAAMLLRKHGDRIAEANALGKAALSQLFTGDQARATATMSRAADLLDGAADRTLVTHLEATHQIGMAEGILGRLDDAERHLARGASLCQSTGQLYTYAQILVVLANARLRSGNLSGALASLDEADRYTDKGGYPAVESILSNLRAEALLWRGEPGDLADAVAAADQGMALADGSPTAWAISARCFNAEFLLHTGEPDRAIWRLLDAAGGRDLPRLTGWRRPRWCDTLAEASVRVGDHAAADRWAALAEASVTQLPSAGRQGFALRARMRAHASRTDVDAALLSAQAAIDDFATTGERIELGRTLVAAAALSLDADRTGAARGWLDRAALLAERCGSARLAADVAAQGIRLAAQDQAAAQATGIAPTRPHGGPAPHRRRAEPVV
ncbi:MAG TPA: AAA family ATPase [Actinocrinis sp.]|nr:AAA family ATPase [Actinocrinis sp.]